jgi:hypothetical protein
MNNLMPCITDSDEFRFEPDGLEDESPLTLIEQEISWICDSWADALEIDTADEWRNVRAELYGARQALIYCHGHYAASKALAELSEIASKNVTDCITCGRYEGAAA